MVNVPFVPKQVVGLLDVMPDITGVLGSVNVALTALEVHAAKVTRMFV